MSDVGAIAVHGEPPRRVERKAKRAPYHAWKSGEIRLLMRDYPTGRPVASIAAEIGTSAARVRTKANDLGLSRDHRYSPDDDRLVLDTTRPVKEIAATLLRTQGAIARRRQLLRASQSNGVPA